MQFTIAIDGPSAAGKGTTSRALARNFGFAHLDTGLLYRATAARVAAGEAPETAARNLCDADFARSDLRSPTISQEASRVSAIPEVRAALLAYQRDFAIRPGGAVLDGRDIGTEVCPQADLKIFLTASPEARARRRHAEILANGGSDTFQKTLDEMNIRDTRDSSRSAAPLRPARDAIILHTDNLTLEEVIFTCIEHAVRVLQGPGK